jgi:shingomyelin synthase
MADLGSQVMTIANTNQSTVRLTSRTTANNCERVSRTESEPLLPSPSHETHYVPLLTSDHHNNSNNNNITVMIPTTTTATLRPTVTTTITDTSHSSSSAKDRSVLIPIELPDSLFHKNDKLPKEANSLWRSLLAFLFVFCNMTLNLTVLAVIHERVPRSQPALPDLSFDILPDADWALAVAEYVIVIQVLGVFLLIFLHRYRVILFRRLCIIMGVLYLFRAICMASTQLPIANKNYYCSPQLKNATDPSADPIITTGQYISIIASRVFYMSLGMGLSINGRHSYCGDYMYSGHTVILTLAYLMFREYAIPARCRTLVWKFIHLLMFCLTLTGVICILIARGHYFIDVVIAYFATTRIFWIYHTLCYNNALRFQSSTNYLSRVWWWRIFKYFESGHVLNCPSGDKSDSQVAQVVPRSFEWPLPWPKILRRKRRSAQRLLQTQQP